MNIFSDLTNSSPSILMVMLISMDMKNDETWSWVRHPLVLDVCDVSVLVCVVGDNLDPPVRKGHPVLARNCAVVLAGFLHTK